jgi:hypothetical protein
MKVGTILVATDLNPLYAEFIPSFIRAWSILVPEADICVVLVADAIPEHLMAYSKYIRLSYPIPGIHTAFQAQCIRLLYPRQIERDEGVLITDMDMLPMNRKYYVDSVVSIPVDHFVVYRDVCLPSEISMCYNIAHPKTWASMFGNEEAAEILKQWNSGTRYSGTHGGEGWSTDQLILVKMFNEWSGNKTILNDTITQFQRLDRAYHLNLFSNTNHLRELIQQNIFADYHCFRPYSEYKEQNDFVVSCLR